jgi:hypothetical protein
VRPASACLACAGMCVCWPPVKQLRAQGGRSSGECMWVTLHAMRRSACLDRDQLPHCFAAWCGVWLVLEAVGVVLVVHGCHNAQSPAAAVVWSVLVGRGSGGAQRSLEYGCQTHASRNLRRGLLYIICSWKGGGASSMCWFCCSCCSSVPAGEPAGGAHIPVVQSRLCTPLLLLPSLQALQLHGASMCKARSAITMYGIPLPSAQIVWYILI